MNKLLVAKSACCACDNVGVKHTRSDLMNVRIWFRMRGERAGFCLLTINANKLQEYIPEQTACEHLEKCKQQICPRTTDCNIAWATCSAATWLLCRICEQIAIHILVLRDSANVPHNSKAQYRCPSLRRSGSPYAPPSQGILLINEPNQ